MQNSVIAIYLYGAQYWSYISYEFAFSLLIYSGSSDMGKVFSH